MFGDLVIRVVGKLPPEYSGWCGITVPYRGRLRPGTPGLSTRVPIGNPTARSGAGVAGTSITITTVNAINAGCP